MALAQDAFNLAKARQKTTPFYPRTKVRGNGSQKKNIPF